MIVVTGARGQTGRAIVEHLVKRIPSHQVAASVRGPGKAADMQALCVRVRQGDVAKPDPFSPAFEDASQVMIAASNAAQ